MISRINEIPISQMNANEIRGRIKMVVNNITDRVNNGKRVTRKKIGLLLFPEINDYDVLNTAMSNLVNGAPGKKPDNFSFRNFNALFRLSYLTNIPVDWFIWGNDPLVNIANKKSIQDYARLIFVNMRKDLGARYAIPGIVGDINIPVEPRNIKKCHSFLIEIPIDYSNYSPGSASHPGIINPSYQAQRDFIQCAYNIINDLKRAEIFNSHDGLSNTIETNKVNEELENDIITNVASMEKTYWKSHHEMMHNIDNAIEISIGRSISALPLEKIIFKDGNFQYSSDGFLSDISLREPFRLQYGDKKGLLNDELVKFEHTANGFIEEYAINGNDFGTLDDDEELIGRRKAPICNKERE